MEDEIPRVTEEQASAKWLEIAPLIDKLQERSGTEGEFPVRARSSIAGDDELTDPYHASHALSMCLVAGIDRCTRSRSL